MSLPKLNETFDFDVEIPSKGIKMKARPYLTQEEKLLLFAGESGEVEQMFDALLKLISNCIPGIVVDELAIFDIEYIFIQLRKISVGESTTVVVDCEECKHTNEEVTINLNDVKLSEDVANRIIDLTSDVKLEMTYPDVKTVRDKKVFKMMAGAEDVQFGPKDMFEFLRFVIKRIIQGDEQWLFSNHTKEEQDNFIGSLNKQQMESIGNFVQSMPQTEIDIKFNCTECKAENNLNVRGVQGFFS